MVWLGGFHDSGVVVTCRALDLDHRQSLVAVVFRCVDLRRVFHDGGLPVCSRHDSSSAETLSPRETTMKFVVLDCAPNNRVERTAAMRFSLIGDGLQTAVVSVVSTLPAAVAHPCR